MVKNELREEKREISFSFDNVDCFLTSRVREEVIVHPKSVKKHTSNFKPANNEGLLFYLTL